MKKAIGDALKASLGEGDWTPQIVESNVYLSDRIAPEAREKAEEAAARAATGIPGIYAAYTRGQILNGRLPPTDISRRVARSFHPKVSGDLVLVVDPYWVAGKLTGTTHGTPYNYDTSVPLLLAGPGIRRGRFTERASTLDLAPTLSYLLGVLAPSGSEGRVLSRAVE